MDAENKLSAFSRDILFLSLLDCLKHRKSAINDASALAETIISQLLYGTTDGVIQSNTIAQISLITLQRFDQVAFIHYQAFHPLMPASNKQ